MIFELVMPKAGLTMIEGTISSWKVAEGDKVSQGQVVMEFENEKNVIECESKNDGILHIVAHEGETVAVAGVIGYIAETAEEYEKACGAAAPATAPAETAQLAAAETAECAAPAKECAAAPKGGRVKATGYAKKLAKLKGIDLADVVPGKKQGRITAEDVLKAAETKVAAAARTAVEEAAPTVTKLTGIKRAIANNMYEATHTMTLCNNTVELDVTDLFAYRAELNKNEELLGTKITVNDLLTMAMIKVLKRNPLLNSTFDGDSVTTYPYVNISTAVATDASLMIPVIQHAEELGLLELSAKLRDATIRAREGKLLPGEQGKGTFTVTNVGIFPIDTGFPIVSPPQVAIIGFGRTVDKPWVHEGQICIRKIMTAFLTYDHRVIDGATAGNALKDIQTYLEKPLLITV